jgi:hypothetical protein
VPPLRRAGRGHLVDGSVVTWSVAEGSKGRRWREVVVRDGTVVHSLLLETFPDGRFAHLELSTAAGLLTLHPEADAALHGNAVTGEGVTHVVGLPWPDGSVLLVEGSAISRVAAAATIDERASAVTAVRVASDLDLAPATVVGRDVRASVDASGLPLLDGAETWPLELEANDR